jgi:hypothetical protein
MTGVVAWTLSFSAAPTAIETITGPANSLEWLFELGLMDRFNVVTLVMTSP